MYGTPGRSAVGIASTFAQPRPRHSPENTDLLMDGFLVTKSHPQSLSHARPSVDSHGPKTVRQLFVIETQQMENRRLQVMRRDFVFDHAKSPVRRFGRS